MSVTRLDIERAEAEAEITRLRAELENVNDFIPDAVHINALPKALKSYIHDLETRADPAWDIRSRVCAEEAVEAQSMLLAELRAENDKEINHVSDLHIEISGFRAENERLKAADAEHTKWACRMAAIWTEKDAALDRLEWEATTRCHMHETTSDDGGILMEHFQVCSACRIRKCWTSHAPDCWHQAARKAGSE